MKIIYRVTGTFLIAAFVFAVYKGFNPLSNINVDNFAGTIIGAFLIPVTGIILFYLASKK